MNDQAILSRVSQNIRKAMKNQGLTQAELARAASVNPMLVHRVLRSAHMPSAANLQKIAIALGSDISEIMT